MHSFELQQTLTFWCDLATAAILSRPRTNKRLMRRRMQSVVPVGQIRLDVQDRPHGSSPLTTEP